MSDAQRLTYPLGEVTPYINWVYFFHAWGFRPTEQQTPQAQHLHADALQLLREMEGDVAVHCLFRLCRAYAEGDDLWLDGMRFPLLRQQRPQAPVAPFLCLSDFVRPRSSGQTDTVGVFAASVHTNLPATLPHDDPDPYRSLLMQTLTDRLAEAATERLHLYVRREAWGYAPDEALSIPDLLAERFQGIRPAVGYPSLPDQSVNFLLDQLLDMQRIGITLTENGAMHPHSSVSGLMLAHPAARYFAVGPIGEDQLCDYARRRGLPTEVMRKFLAALL